MPTLPLLIANRICQGIQSTMQLNQQQVYPIIDRVYVPFTQRAIQVVPGAARPTGKGQGGQSGGMLMREQIFTLWTWWQFNGDPALMSVDLLTQETQGFLDFIECLREKFTYTFLGHDPLGGAGENILAEPMKYLNDTQTSWHDAKQGIAYRGISFSATYGIIWGMTPSMDDSSFTE